MTLETVASETPTEAPAPAPIAPEALPDKLDNVRSAARLLASQRQKKQQAVEASAEQTAAAPVSEDSAPEADTSPPEAVPSETQETDPAETPSIEPPRSWTKEHKDAFAALPADVQKRVADNEKAREADFLQRQNKLAELEKAIETERTAAEAHRKQYETALPVILQAAIKDIAASNEEFSDIRTDADIARLAAEDLPRYLRWDAHQKINQRKVQALAQELKAAQDRSREEQTRGWQQFAEREDKLFFEAVPEIADPEKGPKLREAAISLLKKTGFDEDELGRLWAGEKISIRDHRLQKLIADGARFAAAQSKATAEAAKPVPPVPTKKPGAARAPNEGNVQAVKALEQRLDQTGSAKDAAKLYLARRKAQA